MRGAHKILSGWVGIHDRAVERYCMCQLCTAATWKTSRIYSTVKYIRVHYRSLLQYGTFLSEKTDLYTLQIRIHDVINLFLC
jgi:hypothetical protein